jgi:MoxR-like ATPase
MKLKVTKDDYCLVARTMGWHGGNSTKQSMLDWFQSRGITMDEVMAKIGTMRAAVRNGGAPVAASAPSIGHAELEAIIDAKLKTATASIDIDEATLQRYVAAAVAASQPARIVLSGDKDPAPVKLENRTHPVFEKVLRLVRAGLNVLLVGPAGCGKTTLAAQVATALKRRYGTMHCTSGASESQLTGWLLPVGDGKKAGAFTYVASEFVELYEEGDSLFLLDEIDAADPNVLLVINAALANGSLHIPQRHEAPHVKRGKNVAIIAAANTFGTGADTMYAGRNQLDAATLDRFYVVRMDYDVSLEAELIGESQPAIRRWEPTKHTDGSGLTILAAWIRALREAVAAHRLRRVVSTRTFQKAVAAYQAGLDVPEIKADLLAGWSRDEMAKAGVTL